MRFWAAVMTAFFVGTLGVSAQTSSVGEPETAELPKIILERDWFNYHSGIAGNRYQYLDGTLLKYKDVRSIISEIPENKVILSRERGWFITNLISGILWLGSLITLDVYLIGWDLPYGEIVRWTTGLSTILFGSITVFSNNLWEYNMRRGVTNYNLYIQGLPIPTN